VNEKNVDKASKRNYSIGKNKEICNLARRSPMKMKKKALYLGILSILLLVAIGVSNRVQVNATSVTPTPKPGTTDNDFYFVYNAKKLEFGAEISLITNSAQIYATTATGISDADSIDWVSSEESVIKITKDPNKQLFATMERKGPGYSTITAIITKDKIIYTISCQVKVELQVDYDATINGNKVFTYATNNDEQIILLNDLKESKKVPLMYVDKVVVDNDTVAWESSNVGVATVDEKGNITAVGAGVADITIKTNTTSVNGDRQTKTVRVIVKPKAKNPATNTFEESFIIKDSKSDFQIISNSSKATDITWQIYDASGKLIEPTNSSILEYSVSNVSGNLNVYNAKAGTYEIYGYSDYKYGKEKWNFLHITVVVPVNVDTSIKVMNVGDIYDIIKNSNIPNITSFAFTSVQPNIASVTPTTGIITAKMKGTTTIKLTLNSTSGVIIDPNNPTTNEIYITVTVIDGLSLSTTNATIYIGGTIQLDPIASDPSRPITWTSSNESVATVKDGLVTGIKEGEVIITAKQTINGVTKTATCLINVQNTITSITIDPANVTVSVNEYATLYAKVDPSALSNVSLKWVSTNEKVVKIINSGKQTATIQGVSGGTAVIIAVNQDNVVIGSCHVTVKQKVTNITLSETDLTVSQSLKNVQLRASVTPDNANNKTILWKSTNTRVATVDSTGMVTLVGPGTASIIATSEDDPSVTAICNINVGVPVSSITLDDITKTMYVGESQRLGYIITPTNATNKNVTWSSTNTAVASVDSTGLVSARSAGIAIIIVKTVDGSIIKTSTITVKEKATGVTIETKDIEISVGQIFTVPIKITPANATDISLIWESTDTKVVTVNDGKITGVSAGKAVIVLKPSQGPAVFVNVTVVQKATGLQLNFTEKTVVVGEKFKLKATLLPSSSTKVDVTFSSSNTKVAKVTAAGNITALKGGTAIITVKTADGKISELCVVHVVERVTSIKLNKSSYRLGVGKSYTLKATIKTNAATNPKIKWESTNPKVATVDSNGKVTGRRLGYTTIIAKALDGSNVVAKSEFRVVKLVTSISLNRTSATTVVGRTLKLTATVNPKTATYRTVYWKSSDESIAVVDSNGLVTALKAGNVTITASAKDSSGKYARAHIIVQPQTPATSVTILNQNLTMVVGETNTLQKAINPIASTDRFTWESDNRTVATVDKSTGKVTARAPGIANITVMTESGKTATTRVIVVGLNTTKLTLEQYSTYTLSVIGINAGVKWDVADNEIVVVRNGKVESRRIGTTTITATVNGRKLTCVVTVTGIR
jgi:uncharacterized protein YjdB